MRICGYCDLYSDDSCDGDATCDSYSDYFTRIMTMAIRVMVKIIVIVTMLMPSIRILMTMVIDYAYYVYYDCETCSAGYVFDAY